MVSEMPTFRVRRREPCHEDREITVAVRPEHEMPMVRHEDPAEKPHREFVPTAIEASVASSDRARSWSSRSRRLPVTTDFVIDETLSLIRRRLGLAAAQAW
jgi:hypothetical protein